MNTESESDKKIKVTINPNELKDIIKEYKKIKKFMKSPIYQVMKMDKDSIK